MSDEHLTLTITRSADVLRPYRIELRLPGSLGLEPLSVLRTDCPLTIAESDRLRSGLADDAFITRASERVSRWLLDPLDPSDLDLNLLLVQALAGSGSDQLRLQVRLEPAARSYRADPLAATLNDLPFELLAYRNAAGEREYFILNPAAAGIVYLPYSAVLQAEPAVDPPWAPLAVSPFRILLVRSDPEDQSEAVPPAAPYRAQILELRPGDVEVELLSSERGAASDGPPTPQALRSRLSDPATNYALLIYLGHGTMDTGQPALILEGDDRYSRAFIVARNKDVLGNAAVVVLVGCMTAAVPPAKQAQVAAQIPDSQRGHQGAAQSLVNSSMPTGGLGTLAAIGMRDQLTAEQADLFLRAFLTSFLKTNPGNVELAVRAARSALAMTIQAWFAPAAFRRPGGEPIINLRPVHALPTAPIRIEEFLLDQGFTPEGARKFFDIQVRSNWLSDAFEEVVLRETVGRREAMRNVDDLIGYDNAIIFGAEGSGKSSLFVELSRRARNKQILDITVNQALTPGNLAVKFRDAVIESALASLLKRLNADPAHSDHQLWLRLLRNPTNHARLQALILAFERADFRLPESADRHEMLRYYNDYQSDKERTNDLSLWIGTLRSITDAIGLTAFHLIIDGFPVQSASEQEIDSMLDIIARLYNPALNFTYKLFLPEVFRERITRSLLRTNRPRLFSIPEWSIPTLCGMLNRRFTVCSRREGNSNEAQLTNLHDICDRETVPDDICEQIAELAAGSPRQLITLVRTVVVHHCTFHYDRPGTTVFNKPGITRDAIEDALDTTIVL